MVFLSPEQRESIFSGYRRIFWGIFIISFHIELGSIQLLPNFIGYMLLASGVGRLRKCMDSSSLKRASIVCGIMIFESLIEFSMPFYMNDFIAPMPLTALVMGVIMVLGLLLYYYILAASVDMLYQTGDYNYAKKTDSFLRIFLVANTLVSIALILLVFWPATALFFVVFFSAIILQLWLIVVFAGIKERYDNSLYLQANTALTDDNALNEDIPE